MDDVQVVMIGHFARDRLVVDGVGEVASGGGVYYGGIALRRMGVRVAVVTRLHPSDLRWLDELSDEGIQVFTTAAPETSGIENIYRSADMERRICHPLGFAGPFQREQIPDIKAQVCLVVPIMAGEVDLSLLRWLAARGPVGLDVQGFVRVWEGAVLEPGELVFRPWPEMAEGLALVTYLKVDQAEAELLTGCQEVPALTLSQTAESRIRREQHSAGIRREQHSAGIRREQHSAGREAARRLAAYGPREVIVTQSSGVTVYADGRICEAPFTPRSLAGRTGRGDTCFATYVGKRLLGASVEEACRFAAAVTTLKQEQPGPWRGTLADVEAVLAQRHHID